MTAKACHLFLSLAIAAGNIGSVQAIYECTMTGQRQMKRCCVEAAVASAETSTPAALPSLRSVCCSVTFERIGTTGAAMRSAARTLERPRRRQCAFFTPRGRALRDLPFARASLDRAAPNENPPARGPAVPLFIAHCAFLI